MALYTYLLDKRKTKIITTLIVVEDVGKLDNSFSCCSECRMINPSPKQLCGVCLFICLFIKLNMNLSYSTAIVFLDIYLREMGMFTQKPTHEYL